MLVLVLKDSMKRQESVLRKLAHKIASLMNGIKNVFVWKVIFWIFKLVFVTWRNLVLFLVQGLEDSADVMKDIIFQERGSV